jgi:phosphoribosyl-AMP cyclohydrolase
MSDLKFTDGLIPVIVQDARSKDVLMMAWANEEAVRLTQETGFAHYYSRSRKKLWKKGEESGISRRSHGSLPTATRTA